MDREQAKGRLLGALQRFEMAEQEPRVAENVRSSLESLTSVLDEVADVVNVDHAQTRVRLALDNIDTPALFDAQGVSDAIQALVRTLKRKRKP